MHLPESDSPVSREGWWSSPADVWPEVCEHAYDVWRHRERSKSRLPPADARVALAFGFAGRLAYGERRDWPELMDQLALDWSAAGFAAPWERVRAAVKQGWTFAQEQGRSQEASRLALREAQSMSHAGSEEQVHGGRMASHGK